MAPAGAPVDDLKFFASRKRPKVSCSCGMASPMLDLQRFHSDAATIYPYFPLTHYSQVNVNESVVI